MDDLRRRRLIGLAATLAGVAVGIVGLQLGVGVAVVAGCGVAVALLVPILQQTIP